MGYHFSLKLFVLICRQLILDRNAPMVKISRQRKFKRFIGNMCAGNYCCDGSIWWMCLGGNNISSRIRKKVSSKQWVIFYASGQFLKSCASWVENMSSLWASPLHFIRNALKMKWPNLQTDLYVSGTATQSFECNTHKRKARLRQRNIIFQKLELKSAEIINGFLNSLSQHSNLVQSVAGSISPWHSHRQTKVITKNIYIVGI